MAVLNIPKRRHSIRLDDSADSPEFVFDLSDDAFDRLRPVFTGAYIVMLGYAEGEGVPKADLAKAYESVISESLGDDALEAIEEYVGVDSAEEATIYLAPVVKYLFELYSDVDRINRQMLAEKYLGPDIAG